LHSIHGIDFIYLIGGFDDLLGLYGGGGGDKIGGELDPNIGLCIITIGDVEIETRLPTTSILCDLYERDGGGGGGGGGGLYERDGRGGVTG